MAAAMKIILGALLADRPDITVQDLAVVAVNDHIIRNGCEFEMDAATRAVEKSGISPTIMAASISHESLMKLGDFLEAMETNCPHKG